ncbi:hypothetical protein ACO0SA_003910 [Hanseniaspora valbyensis]
MKHKLLIFLFYFINLFCTSNTTNIPSSATKNLKKVEIQTETYDRLVYFSKMCAIANCISYNQLKENKTLAEGGCPQHLKFCSDINANKAIHDISIETVILAKSHELGTGYIAIDHMRQVIALVFRGSSTRWDWFHDLRLNPSKYKPFSLEIFDEKVKKGEISECVDCKLHTGFSKFLDTLHGKFMDKLDNIFQKHSDYKLVVAGHSLGAAVAVLAGIEFKLRGFEPMIITYAQPKMFNSGMIEWINELFESENLDYINKEKGFLNFTSGYYRIVHKNDFITGLPAYFRHAGLQINIEKIMLPHLIDDVEYNGLGYYYDEKEKSFFEQKENDVLLEFLKSDEFDRIVLANEEKEENNQVEFQTWERLYKDWLHLYEHRHYFVQVNECDYI